MVCAAFFGDPPDDRPYVNHKDLNKINNLLSNLEYCSPLENTQHALSLGRLNCSASRRGSVLTASVVEQIRAKGMDANLRKTEIAKSLDVKLHNVRSVLEGRSWMPVGVRREVGDRPGVPRSGEKLDLSLAREIRKLWASSPTSHENLAKIFGVCRSTVGNVLSGKSWKEPSLT